MNKKFFISISIICILCIAFTLVACQKNEDTSQFEFVLNSDKVSYTVRKSKNVLNTSELIIPSSYNGKPVTKISFKAFSDCSSLEKIEIPSSVTYVGSNAFEGCSNLTIYCEATRRPSGWESSWNNSNRPVIWGYNNNITTDSDYDYIVHNDEVYLTNYKGSNLEISVPQTIDNKEVVSIGSAFDSNSNITSIEIPSSISNIGSYAFYNCSNLTNIMLPNSITSIADCLFSYCGSLKNIEIPNSVTTIGDRAFEECNSLTSINIPNNITSIGDWAFEDCIGLEGIEITNSTIDIGDWAFEGCISLESIKITNSTIDVGDWAFEDCIGLEDIKITNSTIDIGDWAFEYCISLTNIEMTNSTVRSIGSWAFKNCISLSNIELSNGVTSISGYAFEGCRNLTKIEIPNSVTYIGGYAFKNCNSSLTIYFETESQPSGWDKNWNYKNLSVVWGNKK